MMKAQRHGRRSFPGTPGSTCRRRRDGDAGETVGLAEQASPVWACESALGHC